ncbi:extracellular solute-binding protein [Candidatus Latescibacterota bacterium]
MFPRRWSLPLLAGVLLVLATGVVLRAGMTRAWLSQLATQEQARPVQLRVWDWWSGATNEEYGQYFHDLEAAFERLHPDIDVIYQTVPFSNYVQKLSAAMVGPTPPDVYQSSIIWAESAYRRGMLRPLNDLLAADAGLPSAQRVDEAAFLPSAWRHNHTQDGTVFGIPQIIDAQCLVWNLDILQEAAAGDPEILEMFPRRADGAVDHDRIRFDAVRDWDHFRRLARKLTVHDAQGQVERAGYVIHAHGSGADIFSPWLAANGGRYQDPAGTRALFASPNGVETMHFLAGLYWRDRVCPPFRRQLSDRELFQQRQVACVIAGTWSGKDIVRDTMGWQHFGKTAFPPGPRGEDHRTTTWGNMLVITTRCHQVEAAWRYVRFVCSLEGNLMRSRHLGYNGPRLDFYDTEQWQRALAERPYLSNVKKICLAGIKFRHIEMAAANHQANPVFESVLLHYPEIEAGAGPYPSVEEALSTAARNVDSVYRRYNEQAASWEAGRQGPATPADGSEGAL